MATKKKRYVQVGVGARAIMFYEALASTYKDNAELTAICDINRTRMEYCANRIQTKFNYPAPKMYDSTDFEKMIEEQKPDVVIVTTVDRTHHKYIIKALEMGCDVLSEKPMTMDVEKCQAIVDAVKRTGKNVRVSFNYRYAPHNTIIRDLIANDTIGEVKQIHFEWNLDTKHGADYFRRWHRDKRNSGGLMVHKSTHHFDLVNFWLDTKPKQVFAYGDLMFYGRANAESRGMTKFYYRAHGSELAKNDPFALIMAGDEGFEGVYLNAEKDDGYVRDQSVFGDGISIEDVMSVLVKYENGATMSYSLNAFSPIEGFNVALTGTKGRIEVSVTEVSYVNSAGDKSHEGAAKTKTIRVLPLFGEPYYVDIPEAKGAHGGGDAILLEDLFGENPPYDPYHRAANYLDGAMSILTGIAANKSMATGQAVNIKDLVQF